MFAFMALGAGGLQKKTWTNPPPPSMLTMHGKAYHRIFDLQEQYNDMNVNNPTRMYIYDADFANQTTNARVDTATANSLRQYIQSNIPWASQYHSAVDDIINGSSVPYSSGPAFIEFAEASRVNDGPVLGENVSAPEIAAILYSSGQQCPTPQPIITYPKDSPDSKPRFVPIWSSAVEPLQFPMLFMKGESGWSKGHSGQNPPFKSKTMNRANTHHVPFLFYCRQRMLSEPVFQLNSRVSQEWACTMYSRHEENTLYYIESQLQQRLASSRSVQESSDSLNPPGKLLPASFHGSPAKKKSDTEDALAIVNRMGKPHLFITVTCSTDWPEIIENLLPGQVATDRPDLCCRVFKLKMKQIMADLKGGKVFGPYPYSVGCIEFQERGLPHAHVCVRFKNDGPDNELDKWVWAQLPSKNIAGGLLRERVLKYMIHRPCGGHNVNSPCMDTNRQTGRKSCNKHYPQPWRTSATINDVSGRSSRIQASRQRRSSQYSSVR